MSLALHLEQDVDTWTPRFRKPACRIDSPGPGGPLPSIRGRDPDRGRTDRLAHARAADVAADDHGAVITRCWRCCSCCCRPDPDRLGDAGANPAADLARRACSAG